MTKNTKPTSLSIASLLSMLFLTGLMLSSCSTPNPALSKYQTNFNFSDVSSYSFYSRNSNFSDFQNISDATRNSIELAIEQVLDKNGFVYRLENEADIIVTYHLVNQNAKELSSYNKGVGYCAYCLRGGETKKDKKQWQMIPGSLIIDVINPEKKRSVWRSVYDLKINTKKDNSKDVQLKIYQAIHAMIEKYPRSHNVNKPNNA